jgi:hypothetical protein
MLLLTREAVDEHTWHFRSHLHHYYFLAYNGQKQFTASEAIRINGENPDYSKRNLWAVIEAEEQVGALQERETYLCKYGASEADTSEAPARSKEWYCQRRSFPASIPHS